jgi:hypothetical protein
VEREKGKDNTHFSSLTLPLALADFLLEDEEDEEDDDDDDDDDEEDTGSGFGVTVGSFLLLPPLVPPPLVPSRALRLSLTAQAISGSLERSTTFDALRAFLMAVSSSSSLEESHRSMISSMRGRYLSD